MQTPSVDTTSNIQTKTLLNEIFQISSGNQTLKKDELITCLDSQCYPHKFDRETLKLLLSQPAIYNEQKEIIIEPFIQQYVDLKDSSEFQMTNYKNQIDALITQRSNEPTNPQNIQYSNKTADQKVIAIILVKQISMTQIKQAVDQECYLQVEYQNEIMGSTVPQQFKNNVIVCNEQIFLNLISNQLVVTLKLMKGKDQLAQINLDLSRYMKSDPQDISQQFQINKYNPISNSYMFIGQVKSVEDQTVSQSINTSQMIIQQKNLQNLFKKYQQHLNALLVPLQQPNQQNRPKIQNTKLYEDSNTRPDQSLAPNNVGGTDPFFSQQNQGYSQFQQQPSPLNIPDRKREETARATQTNIQQSHEISQILNSKNENKLDFETYFEVGESEISLVKQIDEKLKLSNKTHAYLFLSMTIIIFIASLIINFYRVQLDLLIILIMWLFFRLNKLSDQSVRYFFVVFIINIFMDIIWLCQVDGNWAEISSDTSEKLRNFAYIFQKLLIPLKIFESVLIWRLSVVLEPTLQTLRTVPCIY